MVVRPIGPWPGPVGVILIPATVGTLTVAAASVVPAVYLAANASRLSATIFNDSPDRFLYIRTGAGVSTSSYTVRLGPRSYYEVPLPGYVGVIEGVWSAGVGGFAMITEYT